MIFSVQPCTFWAASNKLFRLDASTFNCILSCLQILYFLYRLGANFLTQLGFPISLVPTFWPTWHSGLGLIPVPPLFSSPICIVINF